MKTFPFHCLVILMLPLGSQSFIPKVIVASHHRKTRPSVVPFCFALTERQMQFWEDVDDGLAEMETYFRKHGQSLERIRKFVKRYCRVEGLVPACGVHVVVC